MAFVQGSLVVVYGASQHELKVAGHARPYTLLLPMGPHTMMHHWYRQYLSLSAIFIQLNSYAPPTKNFEF